MTNKIPLNSGIIFEMEVFDINGGWFQFARYETGKTNEYIGFGVNEGLLRIEFMENTTKIYLDGVQQGNTYTNQPNMEFNFFIRIGANSTLDMKYKNLKIYSI